jgi:hypothetical protein
MKKMATGLAAALLVASAACGSPTGTPLVVGRPGAGGGNQPSTTLTFTRSQSGTAQPPQTATGSATSLSFAGSVSTPTPCWPMTASHAADSAAVTVTITTNPSVQACDQVLTYNNYQGTIAGLAAGTYTLTIIHNRGGTATTAFSSPVVVR